MIAAILDDLDWAEDALATIIGLSLALPEFTASDLRRELRPAPHPNNVGQAFSAARSLGYIEATGYQTSTNPTRKHGVLRTWRRRINKGVAA
jgi:hypothetical protein